MTNKRDLTSTSSKLGASVALALMLATSITWGQTPPPPGQMPMPVLPSLAHEQTFVQWPVPDYFEQALKMTGLQASARASALRLRMNTTDLPHVVLPVQTQAFGFSPAFRALIGAELDQQLEAAGVETTRQTDIADGHGPYVRRFDASAIDAFAAEHAKKKLIQLYLGHDGITQTFVTLVVQDGPNRKAVHRTLVLPSNVSATTAPLAAALAAMVKESGLTTGKAPTPSTQQPAPCSNSTWNFAPPARDATRGERACHAFAIGMMLPIYDAKARYSWAMEFQSPARLAWLAQAQLLATADALPSATAATIRDIALAELGLPGAQAAAKPLAVDDPVVKPILQYERLFQNSEQSPARSSKDARNQQLQRITESLPPFASALFRARLDFDEAFSQVDLCSLEVLVPQLMPRGSCRKEGSTAQSRTAWPAETLLFGEWRLASYYDEASSAGETQGSRRQTEAALARWPADVAEHPFLQRLRHGLDSKFVAAGNFDDVLKASQEAARTVAQNTADLQRADSWVSGHSLNGHSWTSNLNVMNDAKVRESTVQELRLLSVLRFDRFTFKPYQSSRKPGDTAFFLGPPMSIYMMSGGAPYLVGVDPAAAQGGQTARAPSAAPPPVFKRQTFPPVYLQSPIPPDDELRASIQRAPSNLRARTQLAIGMLRDGGALADALKLIDAQPDDQRSDQRVSLSHAWADPGHSFYFAGEIEPARRYYGKTAEIGSGSESDMMARTRLKLMDGRQREALDITTRRTERYNSDYARRDQAALLFMLGDADKGWQVFTERAASSQLFPLWFGAYTGHRMQKADLARVSEWLTANKFDPLQINYKDVGILYMHLHAVTDRLPDEADISLLKKPRPPKTYMNPLWGASALLVRSALLDKDHAPTFNAVKSALGDQRDPALSFMQPLYTWSAWQATEGKDPYLNEVREATTRSEFDATLSKSMLLALEGQTPESLRYFTSARYDIAASSDRLVPAAYSWALAGVLMHRKTGQDAYRQETLRFVRSQQKVFPYYGWLYAMEASLEKDEALRRAAACRAQHLDAGSYFLAQANVKDIDAGTCRTAVASLLR